MLITDELTDESVAKELGERLARTRLERNLTQAALADQAGISKRTLERLESGAPSTHLSALVRVCRALSLMDRLDALIPPPVPSPIQQLKLEGRKRKRASSSDALESSKNNWTWDDES
jgi:transcriptional regulator with XRE-family HTH domain